MPFSCEPSKIWHKTVHINPCRLKLNKANLNKRILSQTWIPRKALFELSIMTSQLTIVFNICPSNISFARSIPLPQSSSSISPFFSFAKISLRSPAAKSLKNRGVIIIQCLQHQNLPEMFTAPTKLCLHIPKVFELFKLYLNDAQYLLYPWHHFDN